MRLVLTVELMGSIRQIQAKAEGGSVWHRRQLELITAGLESLQRLEKPTTEDSPEFKRVRQRGKFRVWRWAHPYEPGIAVRLVFWFAPDGRVVVALFNGEKSRIGDVWYDSVGQRADGLIRMWLQRQKGNANE